MLDYYRCPHWLSIITAIVFYLIEISIATILCCLILMPLVMDELFDEVLKVRGLKEYVVDRPKPPGATWRITIGSILYALVQLFFMIVTIPLNLIPVFGTVLYCYINGFIFAWGYMIHDHIDFRGMDFKQSWDYTMDQKAKYLAFGAVSYGLSMIPLANWLFMFTCAVGAGLWAADDYEKELKKQAQNTGGQPLLGQGSQYPAINQYSPNYNSGGQQLPSGQLPFSKQ
jgi:uncharacterized protein involved in cysteine biosynthesis